MISAHRLNIDWIDDNNAHIQDPDNRREFTITVRPKSRRFVCGNPVKSRLYVGGNIEALSGTDNFRKQINWAKNYFGPVLDKVLNRHVELKFSSKAGCSCGCSPGFIINDSSIPFNLWMNAK